MSGIGRRFDPSEVRPDAGPGPTDAELAEAMIAARELEALGARDAAGPTGGFEDRVMAAIAAEPAPRLLARPGRNVRYGLLGGFVISVRDAWRVATSGGRPALIRAQAMAFVLLVILATGSLSVFAAVGASSFLNTSPSTRPAVPTVSPAPVATSTPPGLPSPSPTPSPANGETTPSGQTDEPGTSAGPTDTTEPGETDGAEPTETDEAAETDEAKTAKPTRTPRATETPEPEETDEAEPTETDDHGGGDDSSGPGGD